MTTIAKWVAKALVLSCLGVSATSFALVSEIVNYIKQYQIGVDYTNSIDTVGVSYETDTAGNLPESCQVLSNDVTKKRCHVSIDAGGSVGVGIFLQRAFKKQGFWYFDYDVSFGGRYLSGRLAAKNRSMNGLPLRDAKFSLGTFIAKPYIQFGVTPDRWPDVLISVGPALQVASGTFSINDKTERVVVGTSTYNGPFSLWQGFFVEELVLKRFGDGAFSVFSSQEFTGNGEGSKIYPKDIDGMSNFRGTFAHDVGGMAYGFGLKLVTPWP